MERGESQGKMKRDWSSVLRAKELLDEAKKVSAPGPQGEPGPADPRPQTSVLQHREGCTCLV